MDVGGAITGGTGAYAGATGSFDSEQPDKGELLEDTSPSTCRRAPSRSRDFALDRSVRGASVRRPRGRSRLGRGRGLWRRPGERTSGTLAHGAMEEPCRPTALGGNSYAATCARSAAISAISHASTTLPWRR